MEWWRLSRTPTARRAYDWLAARGVRVSTMLLYAHEGPAPARESPTTATVGPFAGDPADLPVDLGADAAASPREALSDLGEFDRGLVARVDGAYAGHVVVTDRPAEVDVLETVLDEPGAYVHRLFVAPGSRGAGLATALVAAALRTAHQWGHDRAWALIAPDNRPSRGTFEACGFEPEERLDYVRLGPFRYRRRTRVTSSVP
jgi:GNAT superfamily N-acetyltransferase